MRQHPEGADVSTGGARPLSPQLREKLSRVETWVFDLDNTLYPPHTRLFDQIESRMTEFVSRRLWVDAEEARRISEQHWEDHGATLTGLMAQDGMPPEPFLAYTHDIDLRLVDKNHELRMALTTLGGRKVVYTNGSRRHALRVTEQLGVRDLFDAFYAIEDGSFAPKPTADGFARIVAMDGMAPERAAMIEDDVRNLHVPKALGMTTIWIMHGEDSDANAGHVDLAAEDLPHFLSLALSALPPAFANSGVGA